jgi:predicted ATPase
MITQIEIDGFKSFKDFKVELAPFQVIVGANASGKSNLFDALQLLGRLAKYDLSTAFLDLRGNPFELFTKLPDGTRVKSMRFAVEMLLDRHIENDIGEKVELQCTRLRYELEITYDNKFGVAYEALKAIPSENDAWVKKYRVSSELLPTNDGATFIDTKPRFISNQELLVVEVFHNKISGIPSFSFPRLARNLLSTRLSSETLMMGTTGLAISAAREALQKWRFVQLNPEELRKPSAMGAPNFLSPQGGNLPTMLARLQKDDEFALTDISRDMAYLDAEIFNITIAVNKARDEYDIQIETSDHRIFSPTVMSDGTLRLLALAAIKNDPQFHGVLCLEEPENSVHPLHLERMARLLRGLATDFSDPEQKDEPLRQVLITTHSSVFVALPEIIDSLLLAFKPLQTGSKETTPPYVTRMVPVVASDETVDSETHHSKAIKVYTINTVRQFLNADELSKADKRLKEARSALIEDGK